MLKLLTAFLLCSCAAPAIEEIKAPTTSQVATTTTSVAPAPTPSHSQIAASDSKESVSFDLLLKNALRQNNPCGQWLDLALSVGWPLELWHQQSYVIWRESRCNFDSHYKADPMSGSRGLMQINGFWCRPNRWTDKGWLQDHGILNNCDDLFNPEINLRAAWAIYNYSAGKNNNGWNPWSMSKSFDPPSVAG